MGYLRFRFSNIRFKLFIIGFVLLYIYIYIYISFFLCSYIFYNELQVSDCLVFLCLTNKEHISPQLSLTNVAALNYLLRSQIFVNDDGQLQVAHLILDHEPLSRGRQRYQGKRLSISSYRRVSASFFGATRPSTS